MLTNSQAHKVINSQTHKLINSQTHKVINPQTHKLINSQAHKVTKHITPLSPWRGVGGEAERGWAEADWDRKQGREGSSLFPQIPPNEQGSDETICFIAALQCR